jgi:hypothetical protein
MPVYATVAVRPFRPLFGRLLSGYPIFAATVKQGNLLARSAGTIEIHFNGGILASKINFRAFTALYYIY